MSNPRLVIENSAEFLALEEQDINFWTYLDRLNQNDSNFKCLFVATGILYGMLVAGVLGAYSYGIYLFSKTRNNVDCKAVPQWILVAGVCVLAMLLLFVLGVSLCKFPIGNKTGKLPEIPVTMISLLVLSVILGLYELFNCVYST